MDDKVDDAIPLFIDFDVDQLSSALNEKMKNNKIILPPLFNPNHPKFVGISHLYSIYYHSYMCILYGLYHPGIMLMGQLIEFTVKEIILVHDGVNHERTFGSLIVYCENSEGKTRRHCNDPLLPGPIINILKRVNEFLRNPYMHLNYTKIFEGEKIRGVLFRTGNTFEKIIENTEKVITKIKNGEVELVEIDPVIDKVLAEATKRQNDPRWAITWAWELFPFFELLIDEYLTLDDYQKQIERYGSKYDTSPLIDDE